MLLFLNSALWHRNQIDLGAWVRVGRADAQVRGGAGPHVVAEHARPGFALPVSTSDDHHTHYSSSFGRLLALLHSSYSIYTERTSLMA